MQAHDRWHVSFALTFSAALALLFILSIFGALSAGNAVNNGAGCILIATTVIDVRTGQRALLNEVPVQISTSDGHQVDAYRSRRQARLRLFDEEGDMHILQTPNDAYSTMIWSNQIERLIYIQRDVLNLFVAVSSSQGPVLRMNANVTNTSLGIHGTSFDGNYIAYTNVIAGNSYLNIMSSDDGSVLLQEQLPPGVTDTIRRWSPVRHEFAYPLDQGNYGIFVRWSAEAGKIVEFPFEYGGGSDIEWSPNGNLLLRKSIWPGTTTAYEWRIEGFNAAGIHVLQDVRLVADDIFWQPDGGFYGWQWEDNDFLLVHFKLDGTQELIETARQPIVHFDHTEARYIVLNEDGLTLVNRADGSRILLDQSSDIPPSHFMSFWSPDGESVVLLTRHDEELNIGWWTVNGDVIYTTLLTPDILTSGTIGEMIWLDNGQALSLSTNVDNGWLMGMEPVLVQRDGSVKVLPMGRRMIEPVPSNQFLLSYWEPLDNPGSVGSYDWFNLQGELITTVTLDGTPTTLSDYTMMVKPLIWSPDGQRAAIQFTSADNQHLGVAVIDLAYGLRELFRTPIPISPIGPVLIDFAWSDDGEGYTILDSSSGIANLYASPDLDVPPSWVASLTDGQSLVQSSALTPYFQYRDCASIMALPTERPIDIATCTVDLSRTSDVCPLPSTPVPGE
ncbi:MAG: hypothetical protein SF029_16505 [bacterium]|nr:hypothetical protein [bacterium]